MTFEDLDAEITRMAAESGIPVRIALDVDPHRVRLVLTNPHDLHDHYAAFEMPSYPLGAMVVTFRQWLDVRIAARGGPVAPGLLEALRTPLPGV